MRLIIPQQLESTKKWNELKEYLKRNNWSFVEEKTNLTHMEENE